MGQYYRPCVMNDDLSEVVATTTSYDWDEGAKLLEHSYYGVHMVRAAVEFLSHEKSGVRFVWCGDYADEKDSLGGRNAYEAAGDCTTKFEDHLDTTTIDSEYSGKVLSLNGEQGNQKYLLNHDKKLAVELTPNTDEEWPIHPLPLLTADGNGRGGGDYMGKKNRVLVGTWAYDHISSDNEVPEGYTMLDAVFAE